MAASLLALWPSISKLNSLSTDLPPPLLPHLLLRKENNECRMHIACAKKQRSYQTPHKKLPSNEQRDTIPLFRRFWLFWDSWLALFERGYQSEITVRLKEPMGGRNARKEKLKSKMRKLAGGISTWRGVGATFSSLFVGMGCAGACWATEAVVVVVVVTEITPDGCLTTSTGCFTLKSPIHRKWSSPTHQVPKAVSNATHKHQHLQRVGAT